MVSIFLGRLALLCALSSVVLAVFWRHIQPKLPPLLKTVDSIFGIGLLISSYYSPKEYHPETLLTNHPKYSGYPLKRVTNEKQFTALPKSTNSKPSFPNPAHYFNSNVAKKDESNYTLAIIYMIIFFIIFAIIRTILTRCKSKLKQYDGSVFRGVGVDTRTSVWSTNGRRRDRERLRRENRLRELISKDGGRSIKTVLSYFKQEWEKQRLLLAADTGYHLDRDVCKCNCHIRTQKYECKSEKTETKVTGARIKNINLETVEEEIFIDATNVGGCEKA